MSECKLVITFTAFLDNQRLGFIFIDCTDAGLKCRFIGFKLTLFVGDGLLSVDDCGGYFVGHIHVVVCKAQSNLVLFSNVW